MRALRAAAHRRFNGRVIVLAPTGKTVNVATREGHARETIELDTSHAAFATRFVQWSLPLGKRWTAIDYVTSLSRTT
jgi:hypothetical protein